MNTIVVTHTYLTYLVTIGQRQPVIREVVTFKIIQLVSKSDEHHCCHPYISYISRDIWAKANSYQRSTFKIIQLVSKSDEHHCCHPYISYISRDNWAKATSYQRSSHI